MLLLAARAKTRLLSQGAERENDQDVIWEILETMLQQRGENILPKP